MQSSTRNLARPRRFPRLKHPVLLISAALILVITASGLVALRTIRKWRDDIIRENTALTVGAASRLALNTEAYFRSQAGRAGTADGGRSIAADDSLDVRLAALSREAFSTTRGVKGGFWIIEAAKFMGYADPWSPPPVPTFGPPPRSYQLILNQVRETIARGESIVRVHEFETVSVSNPVFPLATVPVHAGGKIVAVAWARIHIERELPARRLSRYLQVTALVAVSAFLVVLLMTISLRLEIRRLSRDLRLIGDDSHHRIPPGGGLFGSIRTAINRMLESLGAEHDRRLAAEAQLHQLDKMASLGRMLAGIAHQVKTPLAILKTRIQIWQKDLRRFSGETGQAPPLTEESIGIALHEIDRLSNLLRRLLVFARPVRRDGMRSLNPDDVLRNTLAYLEPLFARQDIRLTVNLNAGSARIDGDPELLREVFMNILSNSIDLVEPGGAAAVATRLEEGTGRLVIDFTNTGPALDPGLRERVFEPFFTTRQQGTGLGLSIAYEVVQAHGGTIEFLETAGDRGAHCRVTFPVAGTEPEVA